MNQQLTAEDFRPCDTCGHEKREHLPTGACVAGTYVVKCSKHEFTPADEPYIDFPGLAVRSYPNEGIGEVVRGPEVRDFCVTRLRLSDIAYADWKRRNP